MKSKVKILSWPNKMLLQVSKPVTKFDLKLRVLAAQMTNAMTSVGGLGISAIQVGHPVQMMIIDTRKENGIKRVIVNPVVLQSGGEFEMSEGCLSFPGQFVDNKRDAWVIVKYQDLDGNWQEEKFEDVTAFCFQHEFWHFEGKTIFNLLKGVKNV